MGVKVQVSVRWTVHCPGTEGVGRLGGSDDGVVVVVEVERVVGVTATAGGGGIWSAAE